MTGVLVTGATTPVGRALVRRLLDDAATRPVLAVAAEEEWPFEPHPDLTYVHADLTKSRGVRALLFGRARDLGIGTIVHSALHRSPTDTGRRVHALNVDSTRELLHLAERHPTIRRFVYRSFADVYLIDQEQPAVIGEEHPIDLTTRLPQGVRDRVEADLMVCTRMGMSPLSIVVLRCAEILAPNSGSQLYDFLESRVCFRPIGYDPMINVLGIEDTVDAIVLAVESEAQGIFNVPGADTLPLSAAIEAHGRRAIAVPGPLLGPIYAARGKARGSQFRYGLNRWRFHFTGVLDGRRAREVLGYEPHHKLDWPALSP